MTRFTCPLCGRQHHELPAYAFEGPALWKAASPEERASGFELGPDLGRYGDEHFFIRTRLEIPVVDQPDTLLMLGVWATVSQQNYWAYRTVFSTAHAGSMGSMFGWLSNEVPGYPESLNLKSRVFPQNDRMRPKMMLEPTDHPLAVAQRNGVTLDEAMRWLHEHGGF